MSDPVRTIQESRPEGPHPDAGPTTTDSLSPKSTTAQTPVEAERAAHLSVPSDGFRLTNYDIGGELARGGMGIVYTARDVRLNRDVAVKVLQEKYEADGSTSRRFVEEARITGQLQHPGVRRSMNWVPSKMAGRSWS
jgi:serine/threonine protein kinase